MPTERILKTSEEDYKDFVCIHRLLVRSTPHVFTARKISISQTNNNRPVKLIMETGYLLDTEGKITRDVSKAFTFNVDKLIMQQEVDGKISEWVESWCDHNISFYKNGLYITDIALSEAQKWLNERPLPRKSISKLTRGQVYTRFNGRCAYCGCELELNEMQVDHFIAHMSQGGEDTLDNYYPACAVCNRVKTDSSIDRFRENIRHCGEIHRKRKKPIMADSDKIAIKYDLTKEDHEITFFYEKYEDSIKIDIKKLEGIL